MIRKFSSLLAAILTILPLASCVNSDNDDDTTYYDDTAVTAFSLGTLKLRNVTKAADGVTDSTYTTTFSGSDYAFNIDQVANTIYNTDSLPYGTDASKVLATITTKNSGTAAFVRQSRSGQDSVVYYVARDSIDFSSPVTLRVYNMGNTAYRDYTVNVNIHQQDGDSFSWSATTGDFATVSNRKIVSLGSDMYLFGSENGQTVGYKKSGDAWEEIFTIADANACKNITAFDSKLYTIINNGIWSSDNGSDWEYTATAQGISCIAGASGSRIYTLTGDGISYSTDGKTWTADSLDDSSSLLPDENVNFASIVSVTDSNVNHLIIIGNRDGKTVIWSKVEENDNASSNDPWAYYSDDDYNRKTLPYMQNLRVVAYDYGLLATGGDFTKFYHSPDQGLTWDAVTTYDLPEGLAGSTASAALATDNDNDLYFSLSGDNRVLIGRLARLGWKRQDSVFLK